MKIWRWKTKNKPLPIECRNTKVTQAWRKLKKLLDLLNKVFIFFFMVISPNVQNTWYFSSSTALSIGSVFLLALPKNVTRNLKYTFGSLHAFEPRNRFLTAIEPQLELAWNSLGC